jgi:Xaa-Pro aminopeptidase
MHRYKALPKSFYAQNRLTLASKMESGGIAVLFSNDILPTNSDGTMIFRQNNDLLYLTGIDQEESFLVVFPDAQESKHKEVLFIKETNDHVRTWEGYKYTKTEAREISGIQTVYWSHEFDALLYKLAIEAQSLYLNSNEHFRASILTETQQMREGKKLMLQFPLHPVHRLAPILESMRHVKRGEEIEMLRKAVSITHSALLRILKTIRPGIIEYQLEAELAHEMISQGCKARFGYHPIFASGINSCILHYNDNDQFMEEGEIILMDFGVDYGNYQSDLTRVAPVSGKFTDRQKLVYDAVLDIQRQATAKLIPGNNLIDYQSEMEAITEGKLIELGLLNSEEVAKQDPERPLFKKYFMHGTSHSLGMDVHDVGSRFQKFEEGMVFTVEPGIYVPEWRCGIRLENNIVITNHGPINLMDGFPITTDEIEFAMA